MTPKGRMSQLPETRPRAETRMPFAACDGHASQLACFAVCESESSVSQTPSRKRSPGPRTLRSLRLRHPTRWHHDPSPQARSPHPSAAPACQRARPRSLGQPWHGRCGYCRFTRPIWPPVPRSGVAPLRSPQSLPYVRPPVKGSGTVSLRSAFPSEETRQRIVSGLP